MAEKVTKTLRLPAGLWSAIEAEAEKHNRSVNGQIEKVLRDRYTDAITEEESPAGLQARVEKLEEIIRSAGLGDSPQQKSEILEQASYLMSDPGGANAGTKHKSAAIRKDIADAKAHIAKKLAR